MDDSIEVVNRKVLDIFAKLAGDRGRRLDGCVVATPAMDAITDALVDEYGWEKADAIAFHMSDWNSDAAFVVALHLFPERFSHDEIKAGIGMFMTHAPNHI